MDSFRKDKQNLISKRRFPRRRFSQNIGVLFKGQYRISESAQIGEGGMMISSDFALEENSWVVVSFMVPGRAFIIVRAQVQYLMPDAQTHEVMYGLKFLNITFDNRRKLRDFIAAKTEAEAVADGILSRK